MTELHTPTFAEVQEAKSLLERVDAAEKAEPMDTPRWAQLCHFHANVSGWLWVVDKHGNTRDSLKTVLKMTRANPNFHLLTDLLSEASTAKGV